MRDSNSIDSINNEPMNPSIAAANEPMNPSIDANEPINPSVAAANEPDEEGNLSNSDDDTFVDDFRNKLRKVRLVALVTNGLYVITSFLDFCSLTWATTVILGGDLESISSQDYAAVGFLLLLGALHFLAARFFGFIVMQKIVSCTTASDPDLLIDSIDLSIINEDKKEYFLRWIGLVEQFLHVVIILPLTVVLPVLNFFKLPLRYRASPVQNCPAPEANIIDCHGFSAPFTSLKIFYVLVFFNALLNIFNTLLIKPLLLHFFVRRGTRDLSLRRFYDKIIWTNLEHGFLQSWVDIDFVSFAFQVQADEYKRNQRALGVMKLYSDMLTYLYLNPRFKGFEKARELLESGDPYEKEAAANIVGCWVKLMKRKDPKKLSNLRLQRKLLTKLAETMDHEETGRAATWSFEALAETNPEATAGIKSEKGECIADRPDAALVFIHVWIHLVRVIIHEDRPNPNYCNRDKLPTLQNDLLDIVKHGTTLKRTQTVAAYALYVYRDDKYMSNKDMIHKNLLCAPVSKPNEKILVHEKEWLIKVLLDTNPNSQLPEMDPSSGLPKVWNNKVAVTHETVFEDQTFNAKPSYVRNFLITALKFSISPSIFGVWTIFFYKLAPPVFLAISHKLQMTSMGLLESTATE